MGEWVFLTPRLINQSWIKNLWNICFVFSLLFTILGIILSTLSLKSGRLKNDKELGEFNAGKYLFTIATCLLLTYFSLFICDLVIHIENTGLNAIARNALWDKYSSEKEKFEDKNSPILIRENNEPVTQENISFSDFSGDKIVRMAFGLEVFTENKIRMNGIPMNYIQDFTTRRSLGF